MKAREESALQAQELKVCLELAPEEMDREELERWRKSYWW
jgi:hypothetical protein